MDEVTTPAEERLREVLETLAGATKLNADGSLFRFVKDVVDPAAPRVHCITYLEDLATAADGRRLRLLDYGCGSAPLRERLSKLGFDYTGVDLQDTTGFRGERTDDADIILYDGTKVPFEDESFDVVYSNQVFEHVLDPFASMGDCARVMRPGGHFVGAVSFLEPYHAFQTFSYTPYGFAKVAERCGLTLQRLSPNRDGLALLLRKLLICTNSPYSDAAEAYPSVDELLAPVFAKLHPIARASFMLQFCGSFSFQFVR